MLQKYHLTLSSGLLTMGRPAVDYTKFGHGVVSAESVCSFTGVVSGELVGRRVEVRAGSHLQDQSTVKDEDGVWCIVEIRHRQVIEPPVDAVLPIWVGTHPTIELHQTVVGVICL